MTLAETGARLPIEAANFLNADGIPVPELAVSAQIAITSWAPSLVLQNAGTLFFFA